MIASAFVAVIVLSACGLGLAMCALGGVLALALCKAAARGDAARWQALAQEMAEELKQEQDHTRGRQAS